MHAPKTNTGLRARRSAPLLPIVLVVILVHILVGATCGRTVHAAEPIATAPANTLVYWGWDGLEDVQEPLSKTGLGKIMGEPAIAKLMTVGWQAIKQEAEKNVGPEMTGAVVTVLETIVATPGSLLLLDVPLTEQGPLPQIVLCLDAGGRSDALLAKLDELCQMVGIPTDDHFVDSGNVSWRRIRLAESAPAILYAKVDTRVVIVVGESTAQAMSTHLREKRPSIATNPRFVASRAPLKGVVTDHLFIDVPALLQRSMAVLAEMGQPLPPLVPVLLAKSGLDKVQGVSYSTALDGAGFRRVLRVGIEGGPKLLPPVTDTDLALIPRDTSFALVTPFDLGMWFDLVLECVHAAVPEEVAGITEQRKQVDEALGFRVREDFIASLGNQIIVYEEPAMRTWLPSLTVVLKPTDGAKLDQCMRKLLQLASAMIPEDTGWGVRVHTTDAEGLKLTHAVFTGLPIPIAPAWAVHGDRLYLALHSTGIEEAIHRRASAGQAGSLLAHEGFRATRAKLPATAHGVSFTDTAAAAHDLYPIAAYFLQMGSSMLGSQYPELQAVLMPPVSTIESHLFPTVGVELLSPDAYTSVSYGPFPISLPDITTIAVGSFVAGMTVPSIKMSQRRAKVTVMRNNIRQAGMLCSIYADDSGGRFPPDMATLQAWVDSQEGWEMPDLDGVSYIPSLRQTGPAELIVFYQTEPSSGGSVIICELGGRIDSIPVAELHQRLAAQSK